MAIPAKYVLSFSLILEKNEFSQLLTLLQKNNIYFQGYKLTYATSPLPVLKDAFTVTFVAAGIIPNWSNGSKPCSYSSPLS